MQHQSDRFLDGGIPVGTDLNIRDFDFYGAAYGVLSAVATGGLNGVLSDIPARDEGEFTAFPDGAPQQSISADFYKSTFAFVAENAATLRRTKVLPVVPGPGVVDGTFAVGAAGAGGTPNTGFVFLFNPTTRAASPAEGLLAADSRLGIVCTTPAEVFVIGQVWPVAIPTLTTVACGGNFSISLEARNALFLTIAPQNASSSSSSSQLRLAGRASRNTSTVVLDEEGGLLVVTGVEDVAIPPGSRDCDALAAPLYALVPLALRDKVRGAIVRRGGSNVGTAAASAGTPSVVVALDLTWAGEGPFPSAGPVHHLDGCTPGTATPPIAPPGYGVAALRFPSSGLSAPTFVHGQAVLGMEYNASFTGGLLTGTVSVPAAVLAQLAARNASYPVPWDAEQDFPIAWLAPHRLIAYLDVNFALKSSAVVTATLNGANLPVLPVWTCRSLKSESCFSGFWVDLTSAGVTQPDTDYAITITLPTGLAAGVFGGVYYDHVDTIYASP
jgi:hypothetical protein